MKLRTLLSIMLIGMISLTAFATTSKLEQKSKPTIILDQKVYVDVVNVEKANDINVVQLNPQSFTNAQVFLKTVDESFNSLTYLDDVGWTYSRINYNLHSKSNLPATNRIPIVSLISKSKTKIRSDC